MAKTTQTSFKQIVMVNAKKIILNIQHKGNLHVITFKLCQNENEQTLSVYVKLKESTNELIGEYKFNDSIDLDLISDFEFYTRYEEDIKEHIVSKLFPCNLTDFYCIQMVRSSWRPVGDLA